MSTPLPPVRRVARLALVLLLLGGLVVAACALVVVFAHRTAEPLRPAPVPDLVDTMPLAGRVIVLDAGHQLGNGRFADEIAHEVPAGDGTTKQCNTTGTATDSGYPEATFAFALTSVIARKLEARGAEVVLTRERNARGLWGPCVDARGRAGNTLPGGGRADLKLSIHGDGNVGGGPGFHVLVAHGDEASLALGEELRDALLADGRRAAAYTGEGTGLVRRDDLATLNLSTMPAAMVELGNMRDPADAAWMQDGPGRTRVAEVLAEAVVAFLG